MNAHRLRAPSSDGGLLAVPPLDELDAPLAANAGRLGAWDHDFQGRRAGRLRAMARRQVFEASRLYHTLAGLDLPESPATDAPLITTGHQPELFHPGVWVKNFAVSAIARDRRGTGLNLVVDNDLPKSNAIRVPRREGDGFRVERVEFDEWGGEIPYEDLRVQDEGVFASFGERARAVLGDLVPDPMLDVSWPRAVRRRETTDRVGERFALARRELEAEWGVRNFEVPLGDVCETEAFLWFASHILAHLPRFQEVHNDALARYRHAYGIRSRHHPVPALGQEGGWREAPFWIWRADEPRRRPLLVRQLSRTMELRIGGEADPLMEIPLGPDREACCAVEQMQALPARRVRLRTRALTTTMFARLLLSDLFVHGIGGAKYDELGDEVIAGFYGIEPPDYLTLSMTLWLGLGDAPATSERLRAVDRELRDLSYNPDRHLDGSVPPEAEGWIEAKRRAIAGPAATRRQRRQRRAAIARSNEALQPLVAPARDRLGRERADLVAGLRRNALARNREYAFVLHSERRLHEAMTRSVGL
jgi:hypothetical protein